MDSTHVLGSRLTCTDDSAEGFKEKSRMISRKVDKSHSTLHEGQSVNWDVFTEGRLQSSGKTHFYLFQREEEDGGQKRGRHTSLAYRLSRASSSSSGDT